MRWGNFISGAVFLFFAGCATSKGMFPQTTGTTVTLSRENFRVIKANAIGESSGFRFLGFIPIVPTRYTEAMGDLYEKAGIIEGRAGALINVTQEESTYYFILFSIPKLTVRADIIQFLGESKQEKLTTSMPAVSAISSGQGAGLLQRGEIGVRSSNYAPTSGPGAAGNRPRFGAGPPGGAGLAP